MGKFANKMQKAGISLAISVAATTTLYASSEKISSNAKAQSLDTAFIETPSHLELSQINFNKKFRAADDVNFGCSTHNAGC